MTKYSYLGNSENKCKLFHKKAGFIRWQDEPEVTLSGNIVYGYKAVTLVDDTNRNSILEAVSDLQKSDICSALIPHPKLEALAKSHMYNYAIHGRTGKIENELVGYRTIYLGRHATFSSEGIIFS